MLGGIHPLGRVPFGGLPNPTPHKGQISPHGRPIAISVPPLAPRRVISRGLRWEKPGTKRPVRRVKCAKNTFCVFQHTLYTRTRRARALRA